MILRRAKLDDSGIFKKLYEDEENIFQLLYISSNRNDTPETNCSDFFDESINELYKNYTLEQFQKELESSSLVYIIEDCSNIIGYLRIYYYSFGIYKIGEWAMFNSNDTDKKVEILNCLKKLKLPRLKSFSICTDNQDVIQLLISNGFKYTGISCIYNLDVV